MVEFAFVGPLACLLLIGTVLLGIIVLHQVQLTQAVRDGARAAAICGSQTDATSTTVPPITSPAPTLPDGTLCTSANIVAYINNRVKAVDSSLQNKETITVYDATNTQVATATGASAATNVVNKCLPNASTVEVSITYSQPLFLPLVGAVFGDSGGNTRSIAGKGEATCEQ
jgi:Flp pilus assembly protein TadG